MLVRSDLQPSLRKVSGFEPLLSTNEVVLLEAPGSGPSVNFF